MVHYTFSSLPSFTLTLLSFQPDTIRIVSGVGWDGPRDFDSTGKSRQDLTLLSWSRDVIEVHIVGKLYTLRLLSTVDSRLMVVVTVIDSLIWKVRPSV